MAVLISAANSLRGNLLRNIVDLDDDQIKVALIGSAYQPWESWPDWQASTAYNFGDIIKDNAPDANSTGHAYEAQTDGGTTGGTRPDFGSNSSNAGGNTFGDGTQTWLDLGLCPPVNQNNFPGRGMLFPNSWSNGQGYGAGGHVKPTTPNGHVYEAQNAGTTGGVEPTWPEDGSTVVDGTITWQDLGFNPGGDESSGTNYTQGGEEIFNKTITDNNRRSTWDGDDVVWTDATVSARWGQIYKNAQVVDATSGITWQQPLIGLILFNDALQDVGSVDADFIIKWNNSGILRLF